MAKADDSKSFSIAPTDIGRFQEILEHKRAELVSVLRKRSDIAIEKSADQLDEIQYATERDLAIQSVDRDSTLLREVRAALLRIQTGSYGVCVECESVINPRRLAAVPWALCCIRCQEADELSGRATLESPLESLVATD